MTQHLPSDDSTPESVLQDYRQTLARFRTLINHVLSELETAMVEHHTSAMTSSSCNETSPSVQPFWWSPRESAVSVLIKISQLFLKMIPLEQKLCISDAINEGESLDEEETSIIHNHLARLQAEFSAFETSDSD